LESERQTWNQRYSEGSHAPSHPDPLLPFAYQNYILPLLPQGGAALEVAGGSGRHSIWLAEQSLAPDGIESVARSNPSVSHPSKPNESLPGAPVLPTGSSKREAPVGVQWQVTLNDISDVGLEQAKTTATERGVALQYLPGDAAQLDFGCDRYDLVLVFWFLERAAFPKLRDCLRPGGLIVYKTYTDEQPRFWERPKNPRHLLQSNELLHAFQGFRVLHYRETLIEQGVAELVAQKLRA
jgi:SAM-dependent methyltransferase